MEGYSCEITPASQEAHEVLGRVAQVLAEHYGELEPESARASSLDRQDEIPQVLPPPQKAGDLDHLLETVRTYLKYSTRLQSPQYIGHQTAVPGLGSIVADMVLGATNNSTAVFDMAPSGVVVENRVIDWMLTRFGWDPQTSAGVLTSGGSLATLTALLAARAAKCPEAWEEGADTKVAVLVPDISHYCIGRAVSIMGMGHKAVYSLPTDASGKIRLERVAEVLESARTDGRRPIIICANAASTVTGSFDDLEAIRDVADRESLWFHVDGAHGASAVISERYRYLVEDARLADSLVWDAHKLLHCGSLCAGVLFRDGRHRSMIFSQDATYLCDEDEKMRSGFFPYAVECTKAPVGLKLYLNLLVYGEDGLGEAVTQLFDRARSFYERINAHPRFEAPVAPESNILLFRHTEASSQRRLYDAVREGGRFHMTFTRFHGEEYLRLTVMNPRTTTGVLDRLLEELDRNAAGETS